MSLASKFFDSNDASVEAPILVTLVLALGLVGLAVAMIIQGHPVSLSDFGMGSAGVMGGGGAAQAGQSWGRRLQRPPTPPTLPNGEPL